MNTLTKYNNTILLIITTKCVQQCPLVSSSFTIRPMSKQKIMQLEYNKGIENYFSLLKKIDRQSYKSSSYALKLRGQILDVSKENRTLESIITSI